MGHRTKAGVPYKEAKGKDRLVLLMNPLLLLGTQTLSCLPLFSMHENNHRANSRSALQEGLSHLFSLPRLIALLGLVRFSNDFIGVAVIVWLICFCFFWGKTLCHRSASISRRSW